MWIIDHMLIEHGIWIANYESCFVFVVLFVIIIIWVETVIGEEHAVDD